MTTVAACLEGIDPHRLIAGEPGGRRYTGIGALELGLAGGALWRILEMLRGGSYPWSVKQRVMSRVGHLSNESLAQFFAQDYDGGASYIVLAHLSEQNNHPEIALRAAENALGLQMTLLQNRVMLAAQNAPTETIRL